MSPIKIGAAMLPIVAKVAGGIGTLADRFSQLNPRIARRRARHGRRLFAAGAVLSFVAGR